MPNLHLPSPILSPISKQMHSPPPVGLQRGLSLESKPSSPQADSDDELELMSALDKLHYDQKARSELHYRPFLASSSPIRGDEQREPNSYTTAMRSRTRARSARQRQDARQDRILLIRGGSARMEEDVMKAETREFFEMMQQEASRYDIEHEVEDEYWYGDDEDIDEPTADAESKITEAYEHELEEMLRLEEEELTAMMMEVTLHN